MTGSIVARRYASALFDLGKQSGVSELENYMQGLEAMREAVLASFDLARVFQNPIFTVDEKKGVVVKLARKLKINKTILNFCQLLAEKGRLDELVSITSAFGEMLDVEKGILRGELFTAVPLDEAKQASIVDVLAKQAKRTLVLNFGVSPEILGGVVLKVGDLVLDASLKAQLSILKDTIKRGE